MEGVTFIEFVVGPVFHVYVVAPLAVNTAVAPEQIVAEFTVTVGFGFTVRDNVLVPTQPAADVPATVYIVEDGGFTLIEDPVIPPGFQV